MATYWTQVDVTLGGMSARFFMSDCGGKDQVVGAVHRAGWKGYEPPLPLLIARQSLNTTGIFIDVGANTGYYSLLAAVCGATQVWAFEPVPAIRTILEDNLRESGLLGRINVSEHALGEEAGEFDLYLPDAGHGLIETSASLNPSFRKSHSGKVSVPVTTLDQFFLDTPRWDGNPPILMKIDVETLEPQVLKGGARFIEACRPTLVVELLPGADVAFFKDFAQQFNYAHYWLNPNNQLDDSGDKIELSLTRRDHLFVPRERLAEFARSMTAANSSTLT